MSKEADRQMISKAIADVQKEFDAKTPKLSPEAELAQKVNALLKKAKTTFVRQYGIRVTPMKSSEAVDIIYHILRQEFATLSKDDFAMISCMLLADMAVESLRSELI